MWIERVMKGVENNGRVGKREERLLYIGGKRVGM